MEIGPKDLAEGIAVLVRRDNGVKRKVPLAEAAGEAAAELAAMQDALLERAQKFRAENTKEIQTLDELVAFLDDDGGFAQVFLDTHLGMPMFAFATSNPARSPGNPSARPCAASCRNPTALQENVS